MDIAEDLGKTLELIEKELSMSVDELLKETAESVHERVSGMSTEELLEDTKTKEMKYILKSFPESFKLFSEIESKIKDKKEEYIELDKSNNIEKRFIEQLKGSNGLYFISNSLNPKGLFTTDEIIEHLKDKLDNSDYKMTIIFGEPIMVKNNYRNNFFKFIQNNFEKMNVFVYKRESGNHMLNIKVFDNNYVIIEYPHLEFCIFRRFITGYSQEATDVINSFYSKKNLIHITSKDQFSNIEKEIEKEFGIRKELNKMYEGLKELLNKRNY